MLTDEHLNIIAAALPGLALIVDQRGECTEILANNEDLLAVDPDATIGQSISDLLEPEHARLALETIAQVIESGTPARLEYTLEKPGETIWLDARLSRIAPGAHRSEPAIAWVANDITDRKRTTAQLKKQADELIESNRVLEEFAWLTSHDLQEPLRKILTYGSQLEQNEEIQRSSRDKRALSRVMESASSMRQLIEDLLAYSRVGRTNQNLTKVSLQDIVSQSLVSLRPLISASDTQVSSDVSMSVQGDRTQLLQLFNNLLSNAVKYRSPERPLMVEIATSIQAGNIQISVRDNGIGFDKKYAKRIFGVFKRLHAKHEYAGTGIGLALCRKIVDLHQGSIVGKPNAQAPGAEFLITLPRA